MPTERFQNPAALCEDNTEHADMPRKRVLGGPVALWPIGARKVASHSQTFKTAVSMSAPE